MQSNALFPIKQVRSLDFLDGTTEIPRETPEKSRRTLISLQEYENLGVAQINSRLSPISLHCCREIPCSQSNREGAVICLMELQKVPKKSLRSLEEH